MASSAPPRYDTIGRTYAATRRTDPRIQEAVDAALGDARTVVNVGAGAGAYEPQDRRVLAVEPSAVMLRQRPRDAAPAVQAAAEALPMVDGAVDAALTVLSLHHWADQEAGLRELRRVARDRVVVLTWDPAFRDTFWLTRTYFPGIVAADAARFPTLARLASWLGPPQVVPVPVPADCRDGFLAAYWRRPEAYLDPHVRAGISTFQLMPADECADGLRRLRRDLESGAWRRAHSDLLDREALDLGYRLLVWGASETRGASPPQPPQPPQP